MEKDDVFVFARQTGGTETKRESARDYGRRGIKEEERSGDTALRIQRRSANTPSGSSGGVEEESDAEPEERGAG